MNEVLHCLEYIELRLFLIEDRLLLYTYLGIVYHKLEADESKTTHDECCKEHLNAVERSVLVVHEERKDNHGQCVTDTGTDRTPCGKRCSVSFLVGYK